MLEIFKILYGLTVILCLGHTKKVVVGDGMNGLKNALLTKINPFFHLHDFM